MCTYWICMDMHVLSLQAFIANWPGYHTSYVVKLLSYQTTNWDLLHHKQTRMFKQPGLGCSKGCFTCSCSGIFILPVLVVFCFVLFFFCFRFNNIYMPWNTVLFWNRHCVYIFHCGKKLRPYLAKFRLDANAHVEYHNAGNITTKKYF